MADIFKSLGDPTRLEIIDLLTKSKNLCVGVIAEKTGMSQPAISQHLKVLKNAGILNAQKMGPEVHYTINQEKITQLKNDVNSLFAEKDGHDCNECPEKIRNKKQ